MLELKYFVLKPHAKHRDDPFAKASQQAMKAYALSIHDTNTEMALQLMDWAKDEETKQQEMLKPRKRGK